MIYNQNESEGYKRVKQQAMSFVHAMKLDSAVGIYKKEACETKPSAYGCYHAAHIMSLFGELQKLPEAALDEWARQVMSYQCDMGYFSNRPDDKKRVRTIEDLEPIWHFTRGMFWTLRVLKRRPEKEPAFLEPLLNKEALYRYVKHYDWGNSWAAGNQICALTTALLCLRDWYGVPYVDELMEDAMYPALEELLDPKTGYWGCQLGSDLLNGQFGTIHVLPTYFAQGWEYRYLQQSVDSTLASQNTDGSFWPCGSDCPDFDGAYMLYNLSLLTDYRKEDIRAAARRYLEHAQMHMSQDGVGFTIHRRDSRPDQWKSRPHFIWKEGEEKASEEYRDENPSRSKIMLGSWFYPLSIALVTGILDNSGFEGPYHLEPMSLHECNADCRDLIKLKG